MVFPMGMSKVNEGREGGLGGMLGGVALALPLLLLVEITRPPPPLLLLLLLLPPPIVVLVVVIS